MAHIQHRSHWTCCRTLPPVPVENAPNRHRPMQRQRKNWDIIIRFIRTRKQLLEARQLHLQQQRTMQTRSSIATLRQAIISIATPPPAIISPQPQTHPQLPLQRLWSWRTRCLQTSAIA